MRERRNPGKAAVGLRAALLAGVLVWGCQEEPPPTAQHVVLITLDTLRADHVGAYGGPVETPHLDRLAGQGALAEQAMAQAPLTRPSHTSLFSGLLPMRTGVRDNLSGAPLPEVPLLAEVLGAAGFETAGFVSSVVVARSSGLGRGFSRFEDAFDADPAEADFLETAQRRGDETLAHALAWLEEHAAAPEGSGRLFLWLHLYDPHEPYDAPEPFASRYRGSPYAAEVAWTDALVGRLAEVLDRLGLAGETLLVVAADHGEGLGEHGEQLHGFFAYESTLRVPLLVRGPGVVPGLRLASPVALVDLFPTVLELAGVAAPAGTRCDGRSLAAALRGRGEPPEAPLYAETLVPRLRFGWSDLRVVRQGNWKLIRAPRPELYDLARDPGEERNRLDEARPEARELARQLAALGYAGSAGPASTATPDADPKDKIAEFRLANALLRDSVRSLGEGRWADAGAKLEELLELGIESAEIRRHLGRSRLELGDLEAARGHYHRAASLEPLDSAVWQGLAEAASRAGDAEGALRALRDGRIALPEDAGLAREEGRLLRRLGRTQEARRALAAAVEAAPRDAWARALLGETLRDLGDVDGALARLQEAVELAPENAGYWNALGLTLGGNGRLVEAEPALRRAVELDASSARYAFNLGLALERLSRPAEARAAYRRALGLDPEFAPARRQLSGLRGGS